MVEKASCNSRGVGFSSLMLLLFIGLKLTGHINWSWWWVFSPFWVPLSIAALCGVLYFVCLMLEKRSIRNRQKVSNR